MDVDNLTEEDLRQLLGYLKDIRFGAVTLIIQDGKIIQIERNEKIRLDKRK